MPRRQHVSGYTVLIHSLDSDFKMSEPGHKKPEGQEETVWDSTYDDPSADTVFVSSDNVRFRVHSWQLKKKR
jgi:hypothetical protein